MTVYCTVEMIKDSDVTFLFITVIMQFYVPNNSVSVC